MTFEAIKRALRVCERCDGRGVRRWPDHARGIYRVTACSPCKGTGCTPPPGGNEGSDKET